MLECQVEYALQLIRRIASEQLAWIDVGSEVMMRYNAGIDEAIANVKA